MILLAYRSCAKSVGRSVRGEARDAQHWALPPAVQIFDELGLIYALRYTFGHPIVVFGQLLRRERHGCGKICECTRAAITTTFGESEKEDKKKEKYIEVSVTETTSGSRTHGKN